MWISVISRDEVDACFAHERIPEGSTAAIMDKLLPITLRRSFDLEKERVMSPAFHYATKECGVEKGGELPAEKIELCSRLMSEQMMPLLRRHLVRGRVN